MADVENENGEQDSAESEQFNSMLSAAKKQVGTGGGSNLTQSQIEAMLAVGDDDEDEEDEDETAAEGDATEMNSGTEEPAGETAEAPAEEQADEGGKKKKEKKPKEKKSKEKAPKEKKEKKPVNKALLAKILTVVGVIVAGAAGFVISLLMYGDIMKTANETLAIKSANALNSKLPLNTQLSVYKAFVRNGAAADECMLYAVTSLGGSDKLDMYRIVINHDDPNTINVYYTLDENSADYQNLLNSDEGEKRIQANVLKTYSDEIYAANEAIMGRSTEWERIDCAKINQNITSSQK